MNDILHFTFTHEGQEITARLEAVTGGGTHALFHLSEYRDGGWYHCGQLFYTEHFGWRYGGVKYAEYVDFFEGVVVGWYQ